MDNNILGLILSFGFVGFALALATALKRFTRLTSEGARKLVHILSANWVIIAILTFTDSRLALIPPAAFIIMNAVSARLHIFKAIERENDASLGTVYYAASVFICSAFTFWLNEPYIAVCGILAMGYGDGLAAIIGRRFGKREIRASKTLMGSFTVYAAAFIVVIITFYIYGFGFAIGAALTLAAAAAAAELIDFKGLDNLTVPLLVTAAAHFYTPQNAALFIAMGVALTVCLFAYGLRKLTLDAALAAFGVGVLLFRRAGGHAFAALIAFFLLSVLCGALTNNGRKRGALSLHPKEGARNAYQVFANGLPPLIFADVYFITRSEVWLAAVFAAICAATADTFAGEIGMAYGKNPKSIFTLKPIKAGLSGGVTLIGLLGGALGSCLIALFAFDIKTGVIAGVCGLLGCLIDSALGQTVQAKYQSENGLTEIKNGKPVKGLPFVSNNVVNFIAPTLAGLIACLLFLVPALRY